MAQQDPLDSAAQRREAVIATLAAAVHRAFQCSELEPVQTPRATMCRRSLLTELGESWA